MELEQKDKAVKTLTAENERLSERIAELLEENNRALRVELGHVVAKQLRIVPELVFLLDTSLDYAEHIEELLKK